MSRAEVHNDGVTSPGTININEDTESGITIIEIKDRKHSGPTSSVISYDSIYLSSESDRQTVLGDENLDEKIKDFEEIIKELNVDGGKADSIIDNLYSQVGKGKAEVATVEPKLNPDTFSKYTDYISKGTLERLTILSGTEVERAAKSEFQYSSLPDAGISELLRDCELIDANLRDDASVQLIEPYPDYDSLPNEVNEVVVIEKARKTSDSKSGPISLEEKSKGASPIELVQLPTREAIDSRELIKGSNTTKIYLPDIGVEFDYENSIASFDSDSDFEATPYKPPIFNLVTISGRKVIVDELAAKDEQKVDKKVVQPQRIEVTDSVAAETEKVNSDDNDKNKAHITLSECKQERADIADKKIVFHLKKAEAAVQSDAGRLLRRNCLSFNMPRPQLLSIIDSKNSAPKKEQRLRQPAEVRVGSDKGHVLNQTEREFFHKVDSARSYWSKIAGDEDEPASNLKQMSKNFLTTKSSNDIPDALKDEEFQSFFPTVEIVELNGGTQAALVTSRKLNDVEFDHVRYKVMKSDMFQKNLLVSNRKETQFDGLMQYLQDYSFQELLANNNVVIIEPVRTKIEKISEKPNQAQSAACKITNGALNRNGSNNLKKHFFYHPIRVNKELYEEELPVPDTVRNVRKLFEGSLKRSALAKVVDNTRETDVKTIRYLTIDTSFDSNNLGVSKWDSISLSSGVSSAADLNSPCECHDGKDNLDGDVEHDDEGEFKSHFVSDDVLEKIRECGSSITYYGGQATGKKINSDLMTKAIMREINGSQKCNCQSRKSSRGTNEKLMRKISSDYSGEPLGTVMKIGSWKALHARSDFENFAHAHENEFD